MSKYYKKAYEKFKISLRNYKTLKNLATIEKKDYRSCEKDMFEYLKLVISETDLPPKKDFYYRLFDMFDIMVACRTKYFTTKNKQIDSLFYLLLVDVCDLKIGQYLCKKAKKKKIKLTW